MTRKGVEFSAPLQKKKKKNSAYSFGFDSFRRKFRNSILYAENKYLQLKLWPPKGYYSYNTQPPYIIFTCFEAF